MQGTPAEGADSVRVKVRVTGMVIVTVRVTGTVNVRVMGTVTVKLSQRHQDCSHDFDWGWLIIIFATHT
jgi:hypothetical protein